MSTLKEIERLKLVNLYYDWLENNQQSYAKIFCALSAGITLFLMITDYLLFKKPHMYSITRIFMLLVIALDFSFLSKKKLANPYSYQIVQAALKYKLSLPLVLPTILFNLMYVFFFMNMPSDLTEKTTVLVGSFMVIVFTAASLIQFSKESYALLFVTVIGLLIASIKPETRHWAILGLICEGVSFGFSWAIRRKFVEHIFNQYKFLATIMSPKLARYAVISNNGSLPEGRFDPKERFYVAFCCDWRGYQKIARSNSSRVISELFELYYDLAFKNLALYAPDGDYYARWIADELFVVFYSEEGSNQEVIEKAIKFAIYHATEAFDEINERLPLKIDYDIGLACGYGLLGLQGPKSAKQTTVSGEATGISKRLETEAKLQRSQITGSKYPLIMFEEELKNRAVEMNIMSEVEFIPVTVTTKDLHNKEYYAFRNGIKNEKIKSKPLKLVS